jgi:RNA polymerase primary sigma factor
MQPSGTVATGMEASRAAIAADAVTSGWGTAPAATEATKLLSGREEAALIRRAQQGDDRARERLIEVNMRLVYSIARRYRCRSLTLDDLVQEGVIGMLVAIDRFDFTQGCRLGTYASHWIRQSIARAIEHNDRLIRLPVQASSELRQLEQARAALRQRLHREPSDEELAEECCLSAERVTQLVSATDPVSLEALIGPDQELALGEIAADENAPDPEAGTLAGAEGEELRRILERLDPRERQVIEYRYGLNGCPAHTLQEMSRRLGISREGVRQIEVRALNRLRRALRASQWD